MSDLIHAPANEFETMCGLPVFDGQFAGHIKHVTCPECRMKHPDGLGVGVCCGNCGGNILMATCDMFRGTGHDWVLVSICMVCRAVHWTESGCLDCGATER